MNDALNEDDVGELRSLKYKIKSCLEHPRSESWRYWDCMLDMQKIYERFEKEGKTIPNSDDFLDLDDMKLLVKRMGNFIFEELKKEENNK